jgi:predicted carbohydrate-binding protein with CBM5 and CBM33 domain
MKKEYNIETINEYTVIWYEENGVRYSFSTDPNNSEYQAYLNKDNPDWNKPLTF